MENCSGQFESTRTYIFGTRTNSLTGFAPYGALTRTRRKSKWRSITVNRSSKCPPRQWSTITMALSCINPLRRAFKFSGVFLRLVNCLAIGFWHSSVQNQNNSACQSNQAITENFAEDINFMLSVHFLLILLIHFDQRTRKSSTSIKLTVPW